MSVSTEQESALPTADKSAEAETVHPSLARFRAFIKGAEERALEAGKRFSQAYFISLEAQLYVRLLSEMNAADWHEKEYRAIRDERNRLELEIALKS